MVDYQNSTQWPCPCHLVEISVALLKWGWWFVVNIETFLLSASKNWSLWFIRKTFTESSVSWFIFKFVCFCSSRFGLCRLGGSCGITVSDLWYCWWYSWFLNLCLTDSQALGNFISSKVACSVVLSFLGPFYKMLNPESGFLNINLEFHNWSEPGTNVISLSWVLVLKSSMIFSSVQLIPDLGLTLPTLCFLSGTKITYLCLEPLLTFHFLSFVTWLQPIETSTAKENTE